MRLMRRHLLAGGLGTAAERLYAQTRNSAGCGFESREAGPQFCAWATSDGWTGTR